MGECLTPIPVKLRAETVAELDAMRAQLPLLPGRSTVARGLLEEVFLLIAEGILQFRSARGNRLLGVSGIPSVSGIPVEFPVPSKAGLMKPITRVNQRRSTRDREVLGNVSRRSCVGVRWAYNLPSLSNLRSIKYNRSAA